MFSNFFIKRPIFAIVVSIVIVLAGLLSMKELPVEQYPNMSPVQIMVTGVYPGADAETVAQTVAAPIETQINGVDNMIYDEFKLVLRCMCHYRLFCYRNRS